MTLTNTATPTTTYAVSAPVFVSETEATMTAAKIANTVNSVTWTWTPAEGDAVTGTFAGETTAPTPVSAVNQNGNQIKIVFSEKVNKTYAEDPLNYTLRNTVAGIQTHLNANTASTIVLGADGVTAAITLSTAQIDIVGINGLDTLDNVKYRLFVNPGAAATTNITDIAGNKLANNSYIEFDGSIAADTSAPILQTAAWSQATKTVTLTFNEKVYSADVTKVSFPDGTTTLTLAAGDTANVISTNTAATNIIYTINNSTSLTKLAALTGTVNLTLAAGAVKDVAGNANAKITMVASATGNPQILTDGVSYNENTSKLTIKLNKVVDITNVGKTTLTFTNTEALTSNTIYNNMPLDTVGNSDTLVFTLNALAKAEIQKTNARKDANKGSYKLSAAKAFVKDTDGNDLGVANNNIAIAYTIDDVALTITDI